MKECRKCHNEIPAYSDYCLHCGAKVAPKKGRTSLEKVLITVTIVLSATLIAVLCCFLWPYPASSDKPTHNAAEEIPTTEPTLSLESVPIETSIELIPEVEPASGRLFSLLRSNAQKLCPIIINAPEGEGHLFAFEVTSLYRDPATSTKHSNAYNSQYSASANLNAVVKVYIRSGESATINFPRGTCNVYLATGDTWYGKDQLFGKDTNYYLLCSNHKITTADLNGTSLILGKFGVGTFGGQTIGLEEISAEEFPD